MTFVEGTLERWSAPLWTLLLPRPRTDSEVIRILQQHCDDHALIVDRQRTVVPNAFVVLLPWPAHHRISPHTPQVQRQLSVQVRRYAAENGYTFAGPVAVELRAVNEDMTALFHVSSYIAPLTRPPRRP
ncbi:FhaA domain-containing protein [Streptomyces sp. BH104]|uniref:FhaA domain-containing protein n=1 Tax=Streptomyces sp. BH104 TaxID=3410407 RepID=UPI003BB77050